MKIKKYQVNDNTRFFKKGDIVYELIKTDYGLARNDTHFTGVYHVSVTRNENGDWPSCTIPLHNLTEIN